MRELFNENISQFDKGGDWEYNKTKRHQLREQATIDLLGDVIEKNSIQPQGLLSIACSSGLTEERIKNTFGITVYGIDAAENALRMARKRGIITVASDVSKPLPFDDKSFNFVLAGEIIEHIFNTRPFLKEINRVLKPDGYVIITTPNLARLDDRIKLLFGKTPRQTSPLHPYLSLHIRPFTFDSLKSALLETGFSDVVLRTNAFVTDFFGREVTTELKFLAKWFPTLGSTLIVRAKRLTDQ